MGKFYLGSMGAVGRCVPIFSSLSDVVLLFQLLQILLI